MDGPTSDALARLIRRERVACLATLRGGAPNASMVSYLPGEDLCEYFVRISRLAWHTQDMERDERVALSIVETDDGRADPQTLERVTLRATATRLAPGDPRLDALGTAWLARFPGSRVTFELADFAFWRLEPREARYVAGFGRTHNLSPEALRAAARAQGT